MVATGLTAWLAVEAGSTSRAPVLALGLAGVAGVAASLWRAYALAVGLALLGASYTALLLIDEPPLDARSVVVSAGLVVTGGLSDWSVELRTTSVDEPGGRWRRPFWIATAGLAALVLGGVLLAVVDLVRTDGIAVEVAGAVAAVAAAVLVVRLATGQRRDPG